MKTSKKLRPSKSKNILYIGDDLYYHLQQFLCPHTKTFSQEGIKFCNDCFKALKIL